MCAAEGRRSPTRDEAGLPLAHWDYRHRAMIAGLSHEKPHDNVAWEIFYPAGPFALLPMLDGHTFTIRVTGAEIVSTTGTLADDGASAFFAFPLVEALNPEMQLPETFDTVVRY